MLQPDEEDSEGWVRPGCAQDHTAEAKRQSRHDTLGTTGPALPEPSASPRAVQEYHLLPGRATHAHTHTHTSDSGYHEPGPTCTEETPLWVRLPGQPTPSLSEETQLNAAQRSVGRRCLRSGQLWETLRQDSGIPGRADPALTATPLRPCPQQQRLQQELSQAPSSGSLQHCPRA